MIIHNIFYLIFNLPVLFTLYIYTSKLKIQPIDLASAKYLIDSIKLYLLRNHYFLKLTYTFQEFSKYATSYCVVLDFLLSCKIYFLLYIKENLTKNISYLINLYIPLKLNSLYKNNPRTPHLKTRFFGDLIF